MDKIIRIRRIWDSLAFKRTRRYSNQEKKLQASWVKTINKSKNRNKRKRRK